MFTSLPVNAVKSITSSQPSHNCKDEYIGAGLLNLIDTCLKQRHFKFSNKYYLQKDGLSMLSPIFPLLAEISISHFEKSLLNSSNDLVKCARF